MEESCRVYVEEQEIEIRRLACVLGDDWAWRGSRFVGDLEIGMRRLGWMGISMSAGRSRSQVCSTTVGLQFMMPELVSLAA